MSWRPSKSLDWRIRLSVSSIGLSCITKIAVGHSGMQTKPLSTSGGYGRLTIKPKAKPLRHCGQLRDRLEIAIERAAVLVKNQEVTIDVHERNSLYMVSELISFIWKLKSEEY